ncbi:hypothetical protein F3I62_03495 [Pseudomonas sp. R-28-1W-6]|uniref:hypothetical protein n=1 Tax=Pseudomonas sp. R-28-1W-6 TaxID=2650101 RepID=UPI001365ED4C|nr:hypothetical protein [Pseudomonas sp. R-28-1W-6]MWV11152.1 hypothetical protein [Pseudomonas sp. R-28-1W-6]
MKLYATKANANRAAKQAGLEQYEVIEQDGQYGFAPVAVEATGAGAAAEEAPAPVAKPRNASSTVESPVKRVWGIADSMPEARRKDVIAECERQGIAFYTARTQYQKWHKSRKELGQKQDA